MYILFQQRDENNLLLPFTDLDKAINYAAMDIRYYDREEPTLITDKRDDNIVAMLFSESYDIPFIVYEIEVDQEFQPDDSLYQ